MHDAKPVKDHWLELLNFQIRVGGLHGEFHQFIQDTPMKAGGSHMAAQMRTKRELRAILRALEDLTTQMQTPLERMKAMR